MKKMFPLGHFSWVVLLLLTTSLQAQTLPATLKYATYDWDAKRQRLPVSAAEAEQPALLLRDFSAHEFLYDAGKKNLRLYSIDHRILRVNTTDGIEQFNKIVVPMQDGAHLLALKARTISPRGTVAEVNQSSIKELKDQDGGRGFRIFAVEGVEKGSEIEYVFIRDRNPNFFGREYLQSEVPAHDVTFELITPENLTFDARVYHGPTAQHDTVVDGKRVIKMTLATVPAAHKEAFAQPKAEQMRIEYKLAYNSVARGQARLFTWADASQYIYSTVYTLSKDELKAADKLLKQINVPAGATPIQQVQAVEQYVKTNINADEAATPELTRVVSTRTASEIGYTRLFAALFRQLKIDHELVVTCDRTDAPFDESFDTWNYLDHYAFYFPATKQLVAPGRPDYRYGMIPAEWTANQGLFIKTVKLGTTESAIGVVREIPTLKADQSPFDLDIKVNFTPALDKSTVAIHELLGGYHAQEIQPYYSFIPEDKRAEISQNLVKNCVPDATFKSLQIINGEAGLNPLDKPFIVDASVESVGLLNRAGPKYLFKIGELLGSQSELYQVEARQFDIENEYNRRYNRTITFELPAGYQVRNLTDLNYDVKAGADAAAPTFLFHSSYAVQGQTVTVTITEHYNQIRWPKQDFESFRSVVNAAANFNKVVLVLEKKG